MKIKISETINKLKQSLHKQNKAINIKVEKQ